ncbi:hypothetical protein AB192_08635 [Aliivibrio fischeri]|nr:hypothetical protein AB192_08635 [Aliivibrio fischeri]
MIKVFLVDDHELVRTGIRRILEDVRGIKVVGEADSGEDAVKWCRTEQADIVLMDMNMPGIGCLLLYTSQPSSMNCVSKSLMLHCTR